MIKPPDALRLLLLTIIIIIIIKQFLMRHVSVG